MDSVTTYETLMRILEGHRRGHYDVQQSVNLLQIFWQQQSEEGRKVIENALWTTLSAEPLTTPQQVGSISPDVLRVVIRAIAAFGPTPQLPGWVFGRLPWQRIDLMGQWAQSMCHELSYSMLHHADRFTQATLDLTKALCSTYAFAQSAQLTGTEFPQVVIEAAASLARTIEHIEYSRFAASLTKIEHIDHVRLAASLTKGEREATPQGDELTVLLRALDPQGSIYRAIEKAEERLQGAGEFDAKQAADLIRACIDETHRGVVAELQKMTGHQCAGADKDGARRTYMRDAGFINEAEEQFFSCIYTLLSREGTHKLLAPRETILVMYQTVKGYLLLLLRRLHDKRQSLPEAEK